MATPIWIDENTGARVDVKVTDQRDYNNYNILGTAITNKFYQYITDGSYTYIEPNTYYYYVGKHPESMINTAFYSMLGVPDNTDKPPQVNRIYQDYPNPRYIMLTNNYIQGTLNPITTQPAPTQPPYPQITIISNALDINNANLYDQRFNIINTQETLTALTNRLNNIKLRLESIKHKPLYSASGKLTFF